MQTTESKESSLKVVGIGVQSIIREFGMRTLPQLMVILEELENKFQFSIFIGSIEAGMISVGLEEKYSNIKSPRPFTFNMMLSMLREFGGAPEKAVIEKLEDNIYYSRIYFTKDGLVLSVDSRTSDAIAFSLFAKVPLLIKKELLERLAENAKRQEEESINQGIRVDDATDPNDNLGIILDSFPDDVLKKQ